MSRRISPTVRAARALTGLITVWCLGCSGFEPLIDALFRVEAASGMACASMERATDEIPTMSASEVSPASDAPAVSAPAGSRGGFDCGCGQMCQAASPTDLHAVSLASSAPPVAVTSVTQPPSVARTPLPPPPERTTD